MGLLENQLRFAIAVRCQKALRALEMPLGIAGVRTP
jgi:hypothetical protein